MKSFSLRKVIQKHMRYLIGGYIAQGILVQDDIQPFKGGDNPLCNPDHSDKNSLDACNLVMRQFPFLLVDEW